ncbi:ABC-type cobalt transport system, ATPase component [Leptotrichia trevisanii]|uniref:ABC-type cobalt transport system, ATPase component n=1 Tax=Leptotrichia trevisanii TaxID=109328 RepID=A0A510L2I3_9FUSO|nr:ABC transporter ATP-binding protein [Leptotrichia trevisanii]BBM53460.1 ABC-type cobalt transport system, ATPase component [Leptotrichia trevisanii]BBM58170.1 ABC-type cobalt transport system, ATPase component [Leptotrichia trevisanii]
MGYFKIENVNYKYPLENKQVLKNINIEIKKGEFWAVIGKNGSGKTTFCNMLRRFVPDFYKGELTGKITLEDKELKDYSQKELVQKIGFVFQNPFTQISGVKDTVFEEIAYGLENLGLEKEEIISKVEKILKLLEIEKLRDRNPYDLSGGQKQRVALASIIAMDPDILVIDEPTSQLDPKGTEDIFKIINLMANEGKTIILVEHKLELIAEYAQNILVLDEGEIILSGKAEEVLNNKILLEKEIGMTQYSMLAYELEKSGKVDLEEIPITKEKTVELLKK